MVYSKKYLDTELIHCAFLSCQEKAKERNNTIHWPKNDNKLKLHDSEKYHWDSV